MNGRVVLRFISYFLLVIAILMGITFALVYYYQGKSPKSAQNDSSDDYAQMVGYIDPEKADYTENYSLCGESGLYGYYHSSAPDIYKGGKFTFREMILNGYENNGYEDSGYLNLRFHINCRGEVGNLEVNELNPDLGKSDMSDELVAQLVKLTVSSDNWELFGGGDNNYYMYLNFKIEDGEIIEILP